MFSPERSDGPHGIGTTVVGQSPGDDLQSRTNCFIRSLNDTVNGLGFGGQPTADFHFDCSSAGDDSGVQVNVTGHMHGVLQIAFNFVQNVLQAKIKKLDCKID